MHRLDDMIVYAFLLGLMTGIDSGHVRGQVRLLVG